MKVLLHYDASPGFRRTLLARAGTEFDVEVVAVADIDRLHRTLCDTEAVFHVLAPFTADLFDRAPRLCLVQKLGVGLDTIDLEAARTRRIAVANMPGTNSQAVAEHTLALMLAALRRIPYFDRMTRNGEGWTVPAQAFDEVGEIYGRTVGFWGFGQVPQRLAAAIEGLGGKVIYNGRRPHLDRPEGWRSREALLAEADVLSLHLPLDDDTRHCIDEAAIARMKPGVVIINTGRGGLIDEPALLRALRDGRVAAAGLDVFGREPESSSNPLFSLDNVVLTPHVAWLTPETLERSLDIAFENCRRLRRGERLLFQVVPGVRGCGVGGPP